MEREGIQESSHDDVTQRPIGACMWLTGPSGAGKSTLVKTLLPALHESGREVTVLDVVPELRKLPGERTSRGKLIRKAFVAREVVRHGGLAICVTISSSPEVREEARNLVGDDSFIEVYVKAPRQVAERRRNTRASRPGIIKRFRRKAKHVMRVGSGRHTEFEAPENPAIVIDTESVSPQDGAAALFELLVRRGVVPPVSTK